MKVARTHKHDWLILILLVIIEAVLLVIEPFHRFLGEEMMTDFKYPLQDNTVPFWAVPVSNSNNSEQFQERVDFLFSPLNG